MKLEEILAKPGWSKSEDFVDLSNGVERPWYVYKHTCTVNGKCYIGISDNPIKRWKDHVYASRSKSNAEYNAKFKRAIRKHGIDVWKKEILLAVKDSVQAAWFEEVRVRHAGSYREGYNSTWGGDGVKKRENLTEKYILSRAKSYRKTKCRWPNLYCGSDDGGYPGDTWTGYDNALRQGLRGLPGGSSLAQLMETVGYVNHLNKPGLTPECILDRIREYHKDTVKWPGEDSGPVEGGYIGDTWKGYDSALREGCRGLPGGSSLTRLLDTIRKPQIKNET
jgi:hypothetical protein